MSALSITKGIIATAVSFGAGNIVANAIKATTPADISTYKRVIIGIGGLAVGGMVADQAVKYTNDSIDEAIKSFHEVKNGIVVVAEKAEPVVEETVEDVKENIQDAAENVQAAAEGVAEGVKSSKKTK
jgi:lipoate-protein ligase A